MLLGEDMRRSIVKEYTEAVTARYAAASRREKSRLLDDFSRVTGYHRKSAIRLLSGVSGGGTVQRRGRPAVYGPELRTALVAVWEASDRLCGKRLAPFMSEFTQRLIEHGELEVSEEVYE